MLNLNDTQAGVLSLVFKIADESQLLLLDMKDLQAMLQHVGDSAKDFQTQYGNISAASIGAIQRGLVTLAQEGGDKFFGEPALNLDDLMQTDATATEWSTFSQPTSSSVLRESMRPCCFGC